jgi:hypothetical protein
MRQTAAEIFFTVMLGVTIGAASVIWFSKPSVVMVPVHGHANPGAILWEREQIRRSAKKGGLK